MASCVESLEAWLAANPVVADTPEAAAALAAAEAIDGARTERLSGAAQQGVSSMVGRFAELMSTLRMMAPPARQMDRLDELDAKRAARRAAS